MDVDPFKCLLVSASREQLRRQAKLNDRFIGNVFLPALAKPGKGKGPNGSPLKHLRVIEQCIRAENKREEQLARCPGDKERRQWAKKFQAQRARERELIRALMVGTTADTEIAITGADSASTLFSRSPLHASVKSRTTGIIAKTPIDDRVFSKANVTGGVPNTKPHIRKEFTLPDCHGSHLKVKPYIPHHRNFSDSAVTHRESMALDSARPRVNRPEKSPLQRGSRSATPLRSSPTRPRAPAEPTRPLKLAFKIANNVSATGGSDTISSSLNVSSSLQQNPIKSPRASGLAVVNERATGALADRTLVFEADDFMLSFEGPTSFLEAQKIATVALSGVVEDVRESGSHIEEVRAESPQELVTEIFKASTARWSTKFTRPSSCPESRSRIPEQEDRAREATSMCRSNSLTDVKQHRELKSTERREFLAATTTGNESLLALEAADELRRDDPVDAVGSHSMDPSGTDDVEEEEQWEAYDDEDDDAAAESANSVVDTPSDSENITPYERAKEESLGYAASPPDVMRGSMHESVDLDVHVPVVSTADEHEQLTSSHGVDTSVAESATMSPPPEALDPDLGEQDDEVEVAEVLFDLVDLVAADHLSNFSGSKDVEPTSFDRDSASTSRKLSATTFIQSVVRGHQARRAFRLALYQEALRSGVLGAMPGSVQGKSGWYQDPKSLMAYYFAVLPDSGEWQQKLVLRCGRLILTLYEMHEDILSKVFVTF